MRNTVVAVAAAALMLANRSTTAERRVPHEVTLDVESLTSTPVAIHVTTRAAASSRTDAPIKTLSETAYTSPAKVVIGADATEVEIITERNQGVRVTFSAGASIREKEYL